MGSTAPDASVDRSTSKPPLSDIRAFLFDLDGVLTPTAEVHIRAWSRMFTPFLAARGSDYTERDYFDYVDGKPRFDGVRSLLASRGIVLPEGTPEDGPEVETVFGLGNRKNADFSAELAENGTSAYAGSAAFVAAAIRAGVAVAVVSSSANAKPVLAAAGILDLFPVVVDANIARSLSLAGKPAPDTYVYAAEQLGLTPAECAVFEDATSGVQAGADGAFGLVIGVDRGAGADVLRQYGADDVVEDLADLIPRLPQPDHTP